MRRPMRSKKVGFAILGCLIAFGMASCGGSSAPTPLVVELSPPSASIAVNSSVQISLQNPLLYPNTPHRSSGAFRNMAQAPVVLKSLTACRRMLHPFQIVRSAGWQPVYPETGYPSIDGGYFAPSTPTTAHVVATEKIYTDIHQSAIKSEGSATSVVTVTSQ